MTGESRKPPSAGGAKSTRPSWGQNLHAILPWNVRRRYEHLKETIAELGNRCDALERRCDAIEARNSQVDTRFDGIEEAIRALQAELESVRGERVVDLEKRLDGTESTLREVSHASARMQEKVVPAIVDRNNLLMNRLASNLDETTSLVERMLRREPLPVPEGGPQADRLSDALREVQPALVEAFRGSEDEIGHRLEWYLSLLRDNDPVLDVGCGRGELLLLLREAGVAGLGVEADPALAQGARRRGLEILEGDAVETLGQQKADSLGAITAIHLVEHLESSSILKLLGEARRALRPGGLFVAECPNPRNLRVGATEFWIDPTHRRPLLPETLDIFLTTSGFLVDRVEYLHPFPEEQTFVADRVDLEDSAESPTGVAEVARRVDVLAARLDDLLNGPRDFVIVASKPIPNS